MSSASVPFLQRFVSNYLNLRHSLGVQHIQPNGPQETERNPERRSTGGGHFMGVETHTSHISCHLLVHRGFTLACSSL
ncbi:unnamed protein product [Arctogadus glacialis]